MTITTTTTTTPTTVILLITPHLGGSNKCEKVVEFFPSKKVWYLIAQFKVRNFVYVCVFVCFFNVFFFFDGKFGGREYDSIVGQFDSSGI
jgi:quinol-cytochrome oxidoreductase complex cytochrome b subunit